MEFFQSNQKRCHNLIQRLSQSKVSQSGSKLFYNPLQEFVIIQWKKLQVSEFLYTTNFVLLRFRLFVILRIRARIMIFATIDVWALQSFYSWTARYCKKMDKNKCSVNFQDLSVIWEGFMYLVVNNSEHRFTKQAALFQANNLRINPACCLWQTRPPAQSSKPTGWLTMRHSCARRHNKCCSESQGVPTRCVTAWHKRWPRLVNRPSERRWGAK